MLAITSKDKVLRIYDPRKEDAAIKIVGAFGGIKSSKCFWADSFGFVGSTGFSKGAKRHLKMWDLRGNTEKPIYNLGIDNAASVSIPMQHCQCPDYKSVSQYFHVNPTFSNDASLPLRTRWILQIQRNRPRNIYLI